MTEPSPEVVQRARKIESRLLQVVAELGLNTIGEAVHCDPSTVSRMKSHEIPRIAMILAMGGLKVVPISAHCYRDDKIEWLIHGAKQYAGSLKSAADLDWQVDE